MKSRTILVALLLVLIVGATITPAAAQDEPSPVFPLNTITVTGLGSAAGAPDIANVEIGVDTVSPDLRAAFNETNAKIESVIAAIVEAGVAREDIRTTGLNVYRESFPPGIPQPADAPRPNFTVSNQVRVTVRDISIVADVIDAAIEAGATNIYGLSFGIDDRAALESEARAAAMENARTKAAELATLAGAELGEIVVINENPSGGIGPFDLYNLSVSRELGAGADATVEPGQLSVTVTLQATFRLNR